MKLKKLFKKKNEKPKTTSTEPSQQSKRTFSFSSHCHHDNSENYPLDPPSSGYDSLAATHSETSSLSIQHENRMQNSLHATTPENSDMGATLIATDRIPTQPIKRSTWPVSIEGDNLRNSPASSNINTFAANSTAAPKPSKTKSFLGKSSKAASSLNASPTIQENPKRESTETTRSSHNRISILGFSGLKQQSPKKHEKDKFKSSKDNSTKNASPSSEQPSFTSPTASSSAAPNISNLLNHLNIAAGESWPPPRVWVPVKEPLSDSTSAPNFNGGYSYGDQSKRSPLGFSVMSYNILSSLYTHRLDNTNLSNVLNNLYSNVAGHSGNFFSSTANGSPPTLTNTHTINASGRPSRTQLQQQLHQQRVNLIAKEIKTYNPDIICFQELDSSDYNGQFRFDMSNYESVYAPKTALFGQPSGTTGQASTLRYNSISGQPLIKPLGYSSSQTQNLTTGRIVEGCGIYFRMDRFHLIEKRIFNYADLTLNNNTKSAASKRTTETLISNEEATKFASEHDTRDRVAGRSHVGIIVVLRHAASNEIVIVCNTQLIPDLKGSGGLKNTKSEVSNSFADVRMVQIGLCLEQIEFYVAKYTPKAPTTSSDNQNKVPVILCGDLNARISSGVYDIIDGKTPISKFPEWNGRRYARFTDPSYEWLSGKRLGLKSSYMKRNLDDYHLNFNTDSDIEPLEDNSQTALDSLDSNQGDGWEHPHPSILYDDSKTTKPKQKTRILATRSFRPKQLIPFTKFSPDSLETFDYIWYSSPTLAVSEVLGTFQTKSKASKNSSENNIQTLLASGEDKKAPAANISTNLNYSSLPLTSPPPPTSIPSPSSLSDGSLFNAPHTLSNNGNSAGGCSSSASSFSSTFSAHSGFTSASTSTVLSSLNSSGKVKPKHNTSGGSLGSSDINDKGASTINSGSDFQDPLFSAETREKEKQLHEFLQYPHPSDHLCIMTKFLFKKQNRY